MRQHLPAAGIFLLMWLAYNVNGREIPSYDSQPTKFAVRELLLRGTTALNHVVGTTPQLLERSAFVAAPDGNYRSAYSPTPALLAAAIVWPLTESGALDARAPLAPALAAKLSASAFTAAAVMLIYLTAARWTSRARAFWIAVAAGLGTGYWSTVSQTLWQHESAALGLAAAVWAFARPAAQPDARSATVFGLGLGIAGTSRPQLAVSVAVLMAAMILRARLRVALLSAAIVGAFTAGLLVANVRWFGHPLGAMPLLEALHPGVHATEGTFQLSATGAAGLLIAPNRGLLVYSPVVLAALAGVPHALRAGIRSPVMWCALAAVCQYLLYSSYTVWWGGHTFGPRYTLDLLPLLAPVGAAMLSRVHVPRAAGAAAAAGLVWSVVVAGTGAFCYPNERWNTDPADVDRRHSRLWDARDLQIIRCWQRGPDPANFSLFDRAAVRPSRAPRAGGPQ